MRRHNFCAAVFSRLKQSAANLTSFCALSLTAFCKAVSAADSNNLAYNINQPLGLFFTALLFLCLSWRLPRLVVDSIGKFKIATNASNSNVNTVQQHDHESRATIHAATMFDSRVESYVVADKANLDLVTNFAGTNLYHKEDRNDKRPEFELSPKDKREKQSVSQTSLEKLQRTYKHFEAKKCDHLFCYDIIIFMSY